MRFGKFTIILIVTLLSLLLFLIFTIIPNSRMINEVEINREKPPQYLLKLDLPEQFWTGQSEKIHLQFKKDNIQPELNIKDQEKIITETRRIQNLEVDIVLPGAELSPPGVSFTPIVEEKDIIMNWKIKPLISQDIQGSVWVYINTIQDGRDEENKRELIFTQNFDIKNKMIFGLKVGTFQWILITLIILNLLFLSLSSRKPRFVNANK